MDEIQSHPDKETKNLGIVKVYDYQVIINVHQWKIGDLGVYIFPDTICDGNRPEFSFLNKPGKPPQKHRIKVKRLRGVYSEGLLLPAPEGFQEGDDAWTHLGLERYVPQIKGRFGSRGANNEADFGTGGGWETSPVKLPFNKYDVENWKKFNHIFNDGEEVVITEKLHGSNSKFCFANDRMYCGSRAGWRTQAEDNAWWAALKQNPFIETYCRLYPNLVLFGEIYGQIQDLKYGAKANEVFFRMFDVYDHTERKWLDWIDMKEMFSIEHIVPVIYEGTYSKEAVLQSTDGPSLFPGADHIREGCVIKPVRERLDDKFSRVILKNVSNAYLERP